MSIYVSKNEKQYGPYSIEQLRKYVAQKNFASDDLACYDGSNWVLIAEVPGFTPNLRATATPPPSPSSSQVATATPSPSPQVKTGAWQALPTWKKSIIAGVGSFVALYAVYVVVVISGVLSEEPVEHMPRTVQYGIPQANSPVSNQQPQGDPVNKIYEWFHEMNRDPSTWGDRQPLDPRNPTRLQRHMINRCQNCNRQVARSARECPNCGSIYPNHLR